MIYLAVSRKNLKYATAAQRKYAAVTGPVYWSHISAYLMVVSFFIVIVRWNAALVVAGSLALTGVVVVGLMGPFEDLLVVVRDIGTSLWKALTSLGGMLARASLALARGIRVLVERAQQFYADHVSKPLRGMSGALVDSSTRLESHTKQKLRHEVQLHAERFGSKNSPPRSPSESAPSRPSAPET